MKRVTYKSIIGGWAYCVPRQEAVDRLAAYEDTGLEPEEIKTLLAEREAAVKGKHAHVVVNWLGDCHCSNCGENIDSTSNYCNWCGAKLDEPEQRED